MPAALGLTDFPLRKRVMDIWSFRNFVPSLEDRNVRHHFFAAFGEFDPVTHKQWANCWPK